MSNLKETIEKFQSIQLAKKRLDFVNSELADKEAKLEALNKTWRKEYADVEALEKLSLKSVFTKILGDKEAQLELERQEYLAAFMKFEQYKKTLDILYFEKDVLVGKVESLDLVKAELEQLMEKRKAELIANKTPEGKVILDLDKELTTKFHYRKETLEAFEMGRSTMQHLVELSNHLKKAKNWGRWDMASSKGGVTKIMKHSAIDSARRLLPQTQHLLNTFKKELTDVYGRQDYDVNLNMDDLSSFTNVFFNNLISDWIVQKKINNAMANVNSVADYIKRTMDSLELEVKKLEKTIIKIEDRKKEIVLES